MHEFREHSHTELYLTVAIQGLKGPTQDRNSGTALTPAVMEQFQSNIGKQAISIVKYR